MDLDSKIVDSEGMISLCLSPLAINEQVNKKVVLAGSWCLDQKIKDLLQLNNIEYTVVGERNVSKAKYFEEAQQCEKYYNKYVKLLGTELNRLHGVCFSSRYWKTLLHSSLYRIIASIIDHYNIVTYLSKEYARFETVIIDTDKGNTHFNITPGGSSRLFHFFIYSLIVSEFGDIRKAHVGEKDLSLALENFGDGKKHILKGEKKKSTVQKIKERFPFLSSVKRALRGELPLSLFKYVGKEILALGNQYLPPSLIKQLLISSGGPKFYFYENNLDTGNFKPYEEGLRQEINFTRPDSHLDTIIQNGIKKTLPTIFIENYGVIQEKIRKMLPSRKIVLLDSQNCNGGDVLNFFIANSVERHKSHHLMICHGGCYGAMEISVQEKIWGQISDTYAMWGKPKNFDSNCASVKMPSLRFFENHDIFKNRKLGQDILLFATGYYPNRYAYNSIFPYTIDDSYDEWQIRFLSNLTNKNLETTVIRDFHQSGRLKVDGYARWARERNVFITSRSVPFLEALRNAKISIQTVPQTTYLETIVADHPTICYWNPDANIIRSDLMRYFDKLADIGVLHFTPESAARQVNLVADEPQKWWYSQDVREGLRIFRENVCFTERGTISTWAHFIRTRLN